jgi:hypothetical protein
LLSRIVADGCEMKRNDVQTIETQPMIHFAHGVKRFASNKTSLLYEINVEPETAAI